MEWKRLGFWTLTLVLCFTSWALLFKLVFGGFE